MTARYERLLIDSRPPEEALTEVTAGLARSLPAAPGALARGVIPLASQSPLFSPLARSRMSTHILCGSQSLPPSLELAPRYILCVSETLPPRPAPVPRYSNAAQYDAQL